MSERKLSIIGRATSKYHKFSTIMGVDERWLVTTFKGREFKDIVKEYIDNPYERVIIEKWLDPSAWIMFDDNSFVVSNDIKTIRFNRNDFDKEQLLTNVLNAYDKLSDMGVRNIRKLVAFTSGKNVLYTWKEKGCSKLGLVFKGVKNPEVESINITGVTLDLLRDYGFSIKDGYEEERLTRELIITRTWEVNHQPYLKNIYTLENKIFTYPGRPKTDTGVNEYIKEFLTMLYNKDAKEEIIFYNEPYLSIEDRREFSNFIVAMGMESYVRDVIKKGNMVIWDMHNIRKYLCKEHDRVMCQDYNYIEHSIKRKKKKGS